VEWLHSVLYDGALGHISLDEFFAEPTAIRGLFAVGCAGAIVAQFKLENTAKSHEPTKTVYEQGIDQTKGVLLL
jgi:hypothetical protein